MSWDDLKAVFVASRKEAKLTDPKRVAEFVDPRKNAVISVAATAIPSTAIQFVDGNYITYVAGGYIEFLA